jgi:hypothetical protein
MSNEISHRGSIPNAMAWMVGLSALLFWMPVVGGLIAGFVGGQKAGSPGRGAIAAILPGLIFTALVILFGGILGAIPIIGPIFVLFASMGGIVLSTINLLPLLIGAVVGGYVAQ